MLITPAERVHAFKSMRFATETKVLKQSEGIVQAIVNVTANRDSDGDVVVPGATAWGLDVMTPKGARFHDKTRVVARTLSAEEVMPGDKSLPQELIDMGVGGLRVTGQYNLKTQDGNEAFESVQFWDADQEWSVGYEIAEYFVGGGTARVGDEVVKAMLRLSSNQAYRDLMSKNLAPGSDPSRFITKWITFEWSDVMFGANALTGTESSKSAGSASDDIAAELERIRVRTGGTPDPDDKAATQFDARVKEAETALAFLALDAHADMKAGRVQASRNETRLRSMADMVNAMLDELPSSDDDETDKGKALMSGRKIWLSEGIEGTYEDTQEDICEAANALFNPTGAQGPYVSVQGTFPDHVIIDVCSPPEYEDEYYDVPWAYAADGETVLLGTPVPIELTINIAPAAADDDSTPPATALPTLPKSRRRKAKTVDDPKNHDFTPSDDDDQSCADCSGKPDAAWHNDPADKARQVQAAKDLREFATIAAERGVDVSTAPADA